MEGLSKGILLQRMEEEYNSLLSNATCSLASSASTSKRVELQDSSSMRVPQRVYSRFLCSSLVHSRLLLTISVYYSLHLLLFHPRKNLQHQ